MGCICLFMSLPLLVSSKLYVKDSSVYLHSEIVEFMRFYAFWWSKRGPLVVFRPAMSEAAADPLYPFISPAPLLPEAVVTLTDVTCPDVVEEADELATGGGGGGRGEGGEQLEKM